MTVYVFNAAPLGIRYPEIGVEIIGSIKGNAQRGVVSSKGAITRITEEQHEWLMKDEVFLSSVKNGSIAVETKELTSSAADKLIESLDSSGNANQATPEVLKRKSAAKEKS